MDYYRRIQDAVEYIESNLMDDLNISEISSRAYFSTFHFQRLFQTISGYSVHEYIRKRRLAEAAAMLEGSDANILEIAVTFRYSSQEAFTRAFAAQFGMTPGKYRRFRESIRCPAKIDFLSFHKSIKGELNMNKPEIINLDNFNIIGYEYRTNLNGERYFREIPGFYDDFGKNGYFMKIPGRISPAFPYGISCNYGDDGSFSFIVGEAVEEPSDKLESGFVNFMIPGGKYAEFKVDGPADAAQNTWRYIYGAWLPNSGYERREGPDFEITDVCSSSYPDRMLMKIYIPIFQP